MNGLEVLHSVQFVTIRGKRLAVLDAEDWEGLIEWLETVEDLQVAQKAFAELKVAGGDRAEAGWLKWDDIEQELELVTTCDVNSLPKLPKWHNTVYLGRSKH